MTQKKYRDKYEAKLLANGYHCQTEGHEHKPATTTGKTLCFACYSKKRWNEDAEYRKAQNERHANYVKNNRERINAIAKRWRDNNPEKHRAAVKQSIAKRKQREQEEGTNE
jgi:hypothetical protein